jgi:hypothetical protein
LLNPARQAARTKGRSPAVFDAEASCDLDKDGFTDLVVSTDPPYDGQGRPPVPLQILFGSPAGLTGRAVELVIPAAARAGNDWPDQPVCGDFDGDGAEDLVVHASDGRLSYLRGPFTRKGAPRAAGRPLPSPGTVPTGPALDVNRDGGDGEADGHVLHVRVPANELLNHESLHHQTPHHHSPHHQSPPAALASGVTENNQTHVQPSAPFQGLLFADQPPNPGTTPGERRRSAPH